MKETWKNYKKNAVQKMRPYILGENTTGWSISEKDTLEIGGMVAKGDDGSVWYVSKDFFDKNYVLDNLGSEKDDCRIFVNHIQGHLGPRESVCCKICGKSMHNIVREEEIRRMG